MKQTVISGGSETQPNPNNYSSVGGFSGNMNPTATAMNNEPNVNASNGNNSNNNPHEQNTGYQNSRQFPPQFQTGFGFDTDDDDIFSDPALRARLNRIRDPFSFAHDPDFFSSFGSFGRRRAGQPDRETGFFDHLPSQFRQYIPEGFGFPSSHIRTSGSPHTPRSNPLQQPQYPPQYYESFAQPNVGSPTVQPSPQQKPKLCDAAIQTEDPELEQHDNQQPGNLQQHGLRNTVDLGQKSPPMEEARGPRSQSAPPRDPNASLHNQNQAMKNSSAHSVNQQTGNQQTSQGTHPMTPQYNSYQQFPTSQFNQTPQYATDQQKPKVFSQPQEQSSFDDGKNVRTVPIFVEGRSDLPTSKTNTQDQQQQYVPPPPHQQQYAPPPPHPQQYAPPPPQRQSYQLPQQYQQSEYPGYEYSSQNQFPPQQQSQHFFQQGQQPEQKHYSQHQHQPQQQQYYQQPPQHQPQQYPQQHQQCHQQQNRPTPFNTQNISPEQQTENDKQIPPQTPQTTECITKIQAIQKDVLNLMCKVEQFTGTRKSKEYMYLDEMLTRNLLKLDTIDTNGKECIRLARKEAIKCIQASINVLEAKADENSKTAQKTVMNEENELELPSSKPESEADVKVTKNLTENESIEQKVKEEIQQVPEENVAIPLPPPQGQNASGEIQKDEISIQNQICKEESKEEKSSENDKTKEQLSSEKESCLPKDDNSKSVENVNKSKEIEKHLSNSNMNKGNEDKIENISNETTVEEVIKKEDDTSVNKEETLKDVKEKMDLKDESVIADSKDNEKLISENQMGTKEAEKSLDSNKDDDTPKKSTKVIRLVKKKKVPSSVSNSDKEMEKEIEKTPSSSETKDVTKENTKLIQNEVKTD